MAYRADIRSVVLERLMQRGLRPSQVAAAAGVHPRTVQRWIYGESVISTATASAILEALELEVVGRDDRRPGRD